MPRKVRKHISIDPKQNILLKEISDNSGMSEAEIMRKAFDLYTTEVYGKERRLRAWANIQAFITERIANHREEVLGEEGRTWRREDLYE